MAIKTIDPSKYVATVNGVEISGLMGDGIMAHYQEDDYKTETSNDGHTTRIAIINGEGEIVLKLAQSSLSNDYLSSLRAIDVATRKGIVVIAIKDLSGTTIATSVECWIKKMPELALGKDAKEREWIFSCTDMDVFIGGNPNFS